MTSKKIMITGGAGFIGTNFVKHFHKSNSIIVVDDLSRRGTDINLRFLEENCNIDFLKADITDRDIKNSLLEKYPDTDIIIHLAGQVAVTTSITDPKADFDSNLTGTINMLEYARAIKQKPIFLFASTNKVYGNLENIETTEKDTRHEFKKLEKGIDENMPLNFHSPYGCSKGGADQYVREYNRTYGIPSVVFRQSCIYGEHQYGIEDQGWIAWGLIALISGRQFTIFGNGKQVRDVLHVSDLADAYEKAIEKIDEVKGLVFNIGGGRCNSLSIIEFLQIIKSDIDTENSYPHGEKRNGDQKIFISDNSKVENALGWRPKVGHLEGIKKLQKWIKANIGTITKVLG